MVIVAHNQEAKLSALWKRLAEATRVAPGSKVNLARDFDPDRHDKQLERPRRRGAG